MNARFDKLFTELDKQSAGFRRPYLEFLESLFCSKPAATVGIQVPRLTVVVLPDRVDDAAFRTELRRRSGRLAAAGWLLIDQRDVKKLVGFRRWVSDAGPSRAGATAFADAFRSLVEDACAKIETPVAGVLVTGSYLCGDSLSIDRGSPVQASRRVLRSIAEIIGADATEAVIIADSAGIEAGSAYGELVRSGSPVTAERAIAVWRQRGDHDWESRAKTLVTLAGFDNAVVVGRSPEPGIAGALARTAAIDPALEQAFADASFGTTVRRLRPPGPSMLAVFNAHAEGKRLDAARAYVAERYSTSERYPIPGWDSKV